MKKFMARIKAAFEMSRTSGVGPTTERVKLFARARVEARRRNRQFSRLRLSAPLTRDILGQKMLLDPYRHGLDRDLLLNGIREPVATGHLMRMLRNDDVVLDIGANIGYYTLIASRIARHVYAVEPHPENMQRLQQHLTLNAADNVETFQVAFGAADQPLNLNCSLLSNWHSCRDIGNDSDGTIEVPGCRIDSFIRGRDKPTFLKMDVEGFELEVLRGATDTLRDLRGIFLELHGDILTHAEIRELLDMISGNDFRASLIVQYDWPGMSRVYPPEHIERIYSGDRGTYELFFFRNE